MKFRSEEPKSPMGIRASGHVWASLSPELVWVYDAAVPPGRGDFHDRRERQISAWLVRRGQAKIRIGAERWMANPGEWMICQARDLHQTFTADAALLSVRCQLGWPDGHPLFSGGPVAVFHSSQAPHFLELSTRLARFRGNIDWKSPAIPLRNLAVTYRDYLREERLLTDWIAALFGALGKAGRPVQLPTMNDARVARACRLLDSLKAGAAFPADELVAQTGLTLGHLNRLFAGEHGCTLRTYRARVLLERAKQSISDSSRGIKETAHELGFVQLSNFSAWFKKGAGMSPRRYQKLLVARQPHPTHGSTTETNESPQNPQS